MFKSIDQNRKGEIFIIAGGVFWGLFPVITILSLSNLVPFASLAWSTLFATVFFTIVMILRGNWKELKNTDALKDILWVTFTIGILFYVLLFSGLKYTSAGNASIIAQSEIFFSFVFFHIWYKDYISKEHIVGSILMLSGTVLILYPNFTEFKIGDILILTAAIIAPIGNFFQQRARRQVSSETILFVRSLVATPILFGIAYLFKQTATVLDLEQSFFLLLINGIVLLGFSKILWVEGIHRISVTKANALSSISPLVTLFFAWLILSDVPTVWQLVSVVPMILGVMLLGVNRASNSTI